MLKKTVAGGINYMGRVAKTEAWKHEWYPKCAPINTSKAPGYEYNPGNIYDAYKSDQGLSQSQAAHVASCLTPL